MKAINEEMPRDIRAGRGVGRAQRRDPCHRGRGGL